MQQKNRTLLNTAALILMKQYKFDLDNVVLTGSLALDMYGLLPENREVHDVDVIVDVTDSEWGAIRLKSEIIDELPGLPPGQYNYLNYREQVYVTVGNIHINIFREKIPQNCTLIDSFTGIKINPINNIIRAKKKINRQKDADDITDIACNILKMK